MESGVALDTYLEMKEKLESSEARIQELQNNNAHMRSQLDELCSTVSTDTSLCRIDVCVEEWTLLVMFYFYNYANISCNNCKSG